MSEEYRICRPGFERGDYVYIGYGTYKGFIGRYYSAFPVPYNEGYTDQSLIEVLLWDKSPVKSMPRSTSEMVKIHDSCYTKINVEDLQSSYDAYSEDKSNNSENTTIINTDSNQNDVVGALNIIKEYLDEESMQMIARQVFQAKMNMLFDQVYQARTKVGNSLYDEIMIRITDEQLKKFEPELNGIFMKRIEQEILRTDKPEEGDQTFREWLRFALQRKAGEWIKDHQAEVYDLMQDSIQVAASHLCQDKLCEGLGDQVGKILKDKF